MRMNRCNQILKKACSLKQSLEKFVGDANRLTDKLLELCNKPVHKHTHYQKIDVIGIKFDVIICDSKLQFFLS